MALALLAALAAGYFLWFRDSSLVGVTSVEVKGVDSAQREEINAALARAAKGMTTLHLDTDRLEAAVASFPTVESIHADASFPHTLRIEVNERPPTMIASAAGKEVSVAADGTVLAGIDPPEGLPRLELDGIPASGRLEGQALDQALVVGAAPQELAPLIEKIGYSADQGVELRMRGGVELRFGSGARAATKWAVAAAVLADPKLDSATYVDVQVPERPAVGGSGVAAQAESTTVPEPTTAPVAEAPVSTEG
jgi:cell division protein FtsQ